MTDAGSPHGDAQLHGGGNGVGWLPKYFSATKKGPEGPFLDDLQTSLEVCRS